jgi:hypothetical protein
MGMVSSTIIDLHPDVNGSVGRLKFSRYVSLDLALPDRSWIFFLMVAARSIILAIIFPVATSSTMVIHTLDSPATSIKLFGYFALTCWC